MRALVVTNMYPSPTRPALGRFVRDQVDALRRIDDLDVELHAFMPGGPRRYARALNCSVEALAARVAVAWHWLVSGGPAPPLYSRREAPATDAPGAISP